jgi:hypothetical protein
MYNRSAWAGLLAKLLSAWMLSHASAAGQSTLDVGGELNCHRSYTATARISFLSVPVFSRSSVGFGFASADERLQGNARTVALRFVSGSRPERAGGLNCFGFIEEIVEQKDRQVTKANYFGLISANKEESFAQAKAALAAGPASETAFVAARAVIQPGSTNYSIRHMLLPSAYRAVNADALLNRIRAEFALPRTAEPETRATVAGHTLGTFLYSLRQAMQAGNATYESRFIYNGKLFTLSTAMRSDKKTGEQLLKTGATHCSACVQALNGTILNEETNDATSFRLWFEKGAPDYLPLRFEFKPKPYLTLVFDVDLGNDATGTEQAWNREARN